MKLKMLDSRTDFFNEPHKKCIMSLILIYFLYQMISACSLRRYVLY